MKKINENMAGILGAILVHMIIVVFFLLGKVKASSAKVHEGIDVNFLEEILAEEQKEKDKLSEEQMLEQWYQQQLRLNRVVNLKELEKELDSRAFEKKVFEDLDAGRDEINIPDLVDVNNTPKEDKVKPRDTYKGAATFEHDFKDRSAIDPRFPTYVCEHGGKIVVEVEINQKGHVISAKIDPAQSSSDPCHVENAIKYAQKTRFNPDFDAPEKTAGHITFYLAAQ